MSAAGEHAADAHEPEPAFHVDTTPVIAADVEMNYRDVLTKVAAAAVAASRPTVRVWRGSAAPYVTWRVRTAVCRLA